MKAIALISAIVLFQLLGLKAHAFTGQDQFKVEQVKPWGEFGFRALGRGKNITEMRFECGQNVEMGLKVSTVNNYGRTTHLVIPAEKLGNKDKCQSILKKYFAGLSSRRGLASSKEQQRTVQLKVVDGGKTLSFL